MEPNYNDPSQVEKALKDLKTKIISDFPPVFSNEMDASKVPKVPLARINFKDVQPAHSKKLHGSLSHSIWWGRLNNTYKI